MDDRYKGVPPEELDVARIEHALEHEDRLLHAERPQARRLLEVEHRKAVGRPQRAGRPLEAVAVGVRLEHRPNLRRAGVAARNCKVVCESARRYGGADGTGHCILLCYKAPRYKKINTPGGGNKGLV